MSMKMAGMSGLMNRLKKMESDVRTQIKNEALEKGGTILLEAVKKEAPYGGGPNHLRDEIKKAKVTGDTIDVHTGKAYHAHLVEFGRSAGQGTYKDKNGVVRPIKWGYTAPNPFMTRAFENKQQDIIEEMGKVVKRGLRM